MEVNAGVHELKNLESEMPRAVEFAAVRRLVENGITRPIKLAESHGRSHIYSETSFMQICDHLEVEFVSDENFKQMDVVDKVVKQQDLKNYFSPFPGESIRVIRVKENMSVGEMSDLVLKIRELSRTSLDNPVDLEQMKKWTDNIESYSKSLKEAGLAMKRVGEMATKGQLWNNDFDKVYLKTAQIIYSLGEALNLSPEKQPKTLEIGYAELKSKKNPEELQQQLANGLNFARFGFSDRTIDENPKNAFLRMTEVYRFLASKKRTVSAEIIIDNVVKKSVPRHIEKSKEAKSAIEHIPNALVGEIVLRGFEETYRKLPISSIIRRFVEIDLNSISNEDYTRFLQVIDFKLGKGMITRVFNIFGKEYLKATKILEGSGKTNDRLLNDIVSEVDGLKITKIVLGRWQDQLKTLGMGKENIVTFNKWLEDPSFFDDRKVKGMGLDHLFFVGEARDLYSVREVNDYFSRAIKTEPEKVREYTKFQKAMLVVIIEQMRLNYPGWVKGDHFMSIREASPSSILAREKLNCVGRSSMLLTAGQMIGLKGKAATKMGHMTTTFELADGSQYLVEPSGTTKGFELSVVSKVSDDEGLLDEGEEVWESNGFRYLVTAPEKQMISTVLSHFESKSLVDNDLYDVLGKGTLDCGIIFKILSHAAKNGAVTLHAVAKETKKSVDEVRRMVKKLVFLIPEIETLKFPQKYPNERLHDLIVEAQKK